MTLTIGTLVWSWDCPWKFLMPLAKLRRESKDRGKIYGCYGLNLVFSIWIWRGIWRSTTFCVARERKTGFTWTSGMSLRAELEYLASVYRKAVLSVTDENRQGMIRRQVEAYRILRTSSLTNQRSRSQGQCIVVNLCSTSGLITENVGTKRSFHACIIEKVDRTTMAGLESLSGQCTNAQINLGSVDAYRRRSFILYYYA